MNNKPPKKVKSYVPIQIRLDDEEYWKVYTVQATGKTLKEIILKGAEAFTPVPTDSQ